MLLSDGDLTTLLLKMQFETDEPARPFDPAQVQPCSIDLRLDRCFWQPRRPLRASIDLRLPHSELDIKRLYVPEWISGAEGIKIDPGRMLLARTFEKFTMPNGYAGKIEGRSSFARLGLAVHATGDFINPGWRGRMPLQIVNHGRVPIILHPYIKICQLQVIHTTMASIRPYGSADAGHKYIDDNGGPSRWWEDQHQQRLQEALGKAKLPEQIKEQFMKVIGERDTAVIDRFLNFLNSLRPDQITSAREVLMKFAQKDTRRVGRKNRWIDFVKWAGLLPAGTSLGSLLKMPYENGHYALWIASIMLLPAGIWAMLADKAASPITEADIEKQIGKV